MSEIEKVFVTGVYSSGKTYFAKRYGKKHGLPYISLDHLHDYTSKENQSKKILNNLPPSFIIDAIPFDVQSGWADFIEHERRNDVLVICVYCPDRRIWFERVYEKYERSYLARLGHLQRLICLLKGVYYKIRYSHDRKLSIDYNPHRSAYREFFENFVDHLDQFKHIKYYDSIQQEYTLKEELIERVGFKYFPLENHLDEQGENYDKWYQDIEILNFVGYTESHKTWERIKDLVDWIGKTVNDLGCFHGYFAFKAEDAGAMVYGFDRSVPVLTTARMINDLRGGNGTFLEWKDGDDVPECDIVLCLNVLHHFEDQENAISRIKCKQAIFEINKDCLQVVEKYFAVIRQVASHRVNRTIMLCTPRGSSDK